ncbi:EAL domain-containing protein [Pelosinus sp. sgz500959]|uniref:EAL domain-containing protein n=1 Tax=Pelosinus sp. sgz500959 TaxID=3242472 RepID=UPI0036705300
METVNKTNTKLPRNQDPTYHYLQKLVVLSEKVAKQRHISAIRRGLLLNMPFIVIGSFAIMLMNFPLPAYQQSMITILGPEWQTIFSSIYNATFGMMSILIVLAISYFLAESSQFTQNGTIHPAMASIVSLTCLIAIMHPISSQGLLGLPLDWLGILGLFPAILTAMITSEIFFYLISIKKMCIGIFLDEPDPIVSQAVNAILPAAITLFLFAFMKYMATLIGIQDFHHFFYDLIKLPFIQMQNTLVMGIIFQIMVQFLWFIGVHGQNLLSAIFQGVYSSVADHNMVIYLAGEAPTEILTSTFISTYVTIGGTGSTLSLIIAILMVSRKDNRAWLAKLSIIPGIFNINELLIFGLPIVLNPIYLIPFLMVPIMSTLISYAATVMGFVPVTSDVFTWTMPVLLNGYMSSHSWTGVVLQLINIIVGVALYLPFVLLADKQKHLEMRHAIDHLFELAISQQAYVPQGIFTRRDSIGNLARVLAYDLKVALDKQELLLEYQPQIGQDERVTGVEALLRWPHQRFGRIPPPLIIMIAEESGLIHTLGKWVIDTACQQHKIWNDAGINVLMSVNVSSTQFYQGRILEDISQALFKNNIPPQELEIEITENIAMNNDLQTHNILTNLHEMGIRIAIDDFGMGHSSLTYIKDFPIDTLKIDRSLSIDMTRDKNCQEIVASIITLCSSLDIKTIVEYVETEEQRDKLRQLGCVHYQGYLYSPALPAKKAYEYISKRNLEIV